MRRSLCRVASSPLASSRWYGSQRTASSPLSHYQRSLVHESAVKSFTGHVTPPLFKLLSGVNKRRYSSMQEMELVGAVDNVEGSEDLTFVPSRVGAVTISNKNWPLAIPGEVLLETNFGGTRTLGRVLKRVSLKSYQFNLDTPNGKIRASPSYSAFQLAGFKYLDYNAINRIESGASNLLQSLSPTAVDELWDRFYSEGKSMVGLEDVVAALWPQVYHLMNTPTEIAAELYAAHRILNENFVHFARTKQSFFVRPIEQKELISQQNALLDMESPNHLTFLTKLSRRIAANIGLPPVQSPIMIHNVKQMMTTAEIAEAQTMELEWNGDDLLRLEAVRSFGLTKLHHSSVNPKIGEAILVPLGYKAKPSDAWTLLWHAGYITEFDNPHCMAHLDEFSIEDLPVTDEADGAPSLKVASPLSFDALEREDMTRQTVFTIDDDETVEVDDGIGVDEPDVRKYQGDWVYMHIADPTHSIVPGSEVDMYSRKVASSVYLPELVVRMMPESVYQQFSLEPEKNNYTLTFAAKISPAGAIQEYRIFPAVINKIHKINYEEVDKVLSGSTSTVDLGSVNGKAKAGNKAKRPLSSSDREKLLFLDSLARRRKEYRFACGAAALNLPKPRVKVFDTLLGKHVSVEPNDDHLSPSRELVAELMIVANVVASEYTKAHSIPVPYRSQAAPLIPANFNEEVEGLPDVIRDVELVQHMQPATMGLYPLAHSSLAVPSYLQVTSPIRRYHDMIAHYQIKAHLKKRPLPFYYQELQEILPYLMTTTLKVKDVQRSSESMWVLHYLHQVKWENPYKKWKATLVSIESTPDRFHRYFEAKALFEELGWTKKVFLWRPIESPPARGERVEFQVNAVVPAANFLSVKEGARRG